MIPIHVTGVRELLAQMNDVGKRQMPFAAAKALTLTARQAAAAETAHIMDVFDKPAPFTKRAMGFTPATRSKLKATAFVKDLQAKYLQPEVDGGQRGFKSFEEKFADGAGVQIALPGRGMQLNQYGNISKAKIRRIARDVNSSGNAKRFFQGTPKGGSMPSGIYARVNNNTQITPLIVFANAAVYEKRFKFSEIGTASVTANFEANLVACWQEAMRTARP